MNSEELAQLLYRAWCAYEDEDVRLIPDIWEDTADFIRQGYRAEARAVLEHCIAPDVAIIAFMGWLTSRDAVAGPFSGHHEAGQAATLIKQFCAAQGWEDSGERFDRQIEALKKRYPD